MNAASLPSSFIASQHASDQSLSPEVQILCDFSDLGSENAHNNTEENMDEPPSPGVGEAQDHAAVMGLGCSQRQAAKVAAAAFKKTLRKDMGLDGSDLSETWEDYTHSEETNDEVRCLIVVSATHLEKAQALDSVETWESLRIQLDGTLKKEGKHHWLSLNQACFIIATQ